MALKVALQTNTVAHARCDEERVMYDVRVCVITQLAGARVLSGQLYQSNRTKTQINNIQERRKLNQTMKQDTN